MTATIINLSTSSYSVNVPLIWLPPVFSSMPYSLNSELPKSIKDALPAAAQTIYRKAFNSAYESYDGDEEKTIATAWTAVKTKYKKEGTKWVLKKKVESKVVSGGIDFNLDATDEWIPVAKVGQEALLSPDNRIVKYGKDGLISYANTPNTVGVTYNHGLDRILEHAQIDKLKFEEPYLYMQIPEQVRTAMKDPKVSGCSIEGIPQKIEGDVIEAVKGTYLSLIEFPQMPVCKLEDGCGVVSSSVLEQAEVTATTDGNTDITVQSQEPLAIGDEATKVFDTCVVNNTGIIVKIGYDTIYGTKKQLKDEEYVKTELMQRGSYYGRTNLQFYESDNTIKLGDVPPNELLPVHTMAVVISKEAQDLMESDNENIKQSSRGGDVEGMDKEEPITYTGVQVKEMVASAVGEEKTKLENQQEVDINALKNTETKTKEELKTRHATELKAAAELAYKKAETITAFKAKFNPSEEVLKKAEELDPSAIEFMNGLNIPMQESASGVTSAKPKQEENPVETVKDIKTRFYKKLGRGVVEE